MEENMDIKKRIEFICLAFLGLMCLGFDNKKAMVMATVLGLLSAYFLMDSSAKKILLILGCLVITVGLFFYLSVLVLGEEYQRERVQSCISIEKDIRIENVQKNAANIICNAKIINNDLQHEIIKEIGKSYYWAYLAGIGGLFVVAAIIAIYIATHDTAKIEIYLFRFARFNRSINIYFSRENFSSHILAKTLCSSLDEFAMLNNTLETDNKAAGIRTHKKFSTILSSNNSSKEKPIK